ncbi:hypothetical protein AB0B71_16285 [Micromonospora echinofusca]|uniref:hypothetical protein n=1 Tax=Micromonospora echinofusca TaxID=47858 RepID=UPI0033D3BDBE
MHPIVGGGACEGEAVSAEGAQYLRDGDGGAGADGVTGGGGDGPVGGERGEIGFAERGKQ